MCCAAGKVVFPLPEPCKQSIIGDTAVSKLLIRKIRKFNSWFQIPSYWWKEADSFKITVVVILYYILNSRTNVSPNQLFTFKAKAKFKIIVSLFHNRRKLSAIAIKLKKYRKGHCCISRQPTFFNWADYTLYIYVFYITCQFLTWSFNAYKNTENKYINWQTKCILKSFY